VTISATNASENYNDSLYNIKPHYICLTSFFQDNLVKPASER